MYFKVSSLPFGIFSIIVKRSPLCAGKKLAQVALCNGGNDLVGTAFSEEIYRAAGKPTNSSLLELSNTVKEIKRVPIQRNTFFEHIQNFK